jgi:hypothetical protein
MSSRKGAVLLALPLTAALLLTACGGVGRRDYVRRNEAVVKSLPVFPGAAETHEFSTPYYSAGGMSPRGYTTTVVYRVSPRTRGGQVRRFYQTRLEGRGWRPGLPGISAASQERLNTTWLSGFTRGGATAVVNTVTLRSVPGRQRDRFYVVAVDHRGADRR